MKQIEQLQLPNGEEPFKVLIDKLPVMTRAKIYSFVDRVAAGGGKKNIKALGDKIFEIKINYRPGYRVYYGELRNTIILLLLGGDKQSQDRDIEKAKKYWRMYV